MVVRVLRFYFGVMGSSKSAMLLMQRYNNLQLGRRVALVKPAVDTRAGAMIVKSRVGLSANADIVLAPDHSVREQLLWLAARAAHNGYDDVFVDEAQFLSERQVQELADIAREASVSCFGLRTDFRGEFFPGSSALMRLADEVIEVPGCLCWCGDKATMNTRVDGNGHVIKEGEQVLIDNHATIKYIGLCYKHWRDGVSHG